MKKIIYSDGSVNAAVEHCKTYIITFRGSKTKSKYMVILIGHINVTEKIITIHAKRYFIIFFFDFCYYLFARNSNLKT